MIGEKIMTVEEKQEYIAKMLKLQRCGGMNEKDLQELARAYIRHLIPHYGPEKITGSLNIDKLQKKKGGRVVERKRK